MKFKAYYVIFTEGVNGVDKKVIDTDCFEVAFEDFVTHVNSLLDEKLFSELVVTNTIAGNKRGALARLTCSPATAVNEKIYNLFKQRLDKALDFKYIGSELFRRSEDFIKKPGLDKQHIPAEKLRTRILELLARLALLKTSYLPKYTPEELYKYLLYEVSPPTLAFKDIEDIIFEEKPYIQVIHYYFRLRLEEMYRDKGELPTSLQEEQRNELKNFLETIKANILKELV